MNTNLTNTELKTIAEFTTEIQALSAACINTTNPKDAAAAADLVNAAERRMLAYVRAGSGRAGRIPVKFETHDAIDAANDAYDHADSLA